MGRQGDGETGKNRDTHSSRVFSSSPSRPLFQRRLILGVLLNGVLLLFGLMLTLTEPGRRTEFPNRPIKLIVPFSAGGGTDTFARVMKKAITDEGLLPQPLVIINVPGAGATIGSRRVKNALPDGYTLLILHDAMFTAQFSGTVQYGPEAFQPVAGTGEVGMVVAVREESPYRTLDNLMRAARQQPAQINFGANLGALTHYGGLQLEHGWPGAKFQFSQVGGAADRFADLKGGHIEVTGFSIEEFTRFQPGGLRGIAYFGKQPHPAIPNVSVARSEQGEPIINSNVFYWWVPQGTPRDRVDLLADVFQRAIETKYVRKKMDEIQCEPIFLRGAALDRHLDESSARYAAITPPPPVDLPDFPTIILTTVATLAALVIAGEWRLRRRAGQLAVNAIQPSMPVRRTGLAATCFVLTCLFVLTISAFAVDFRIATVVYVAAVGTTLTGFQLRRLPTVFAVAQLTAFGLYLVLTRIIEADLP